MRHRHLNDDVGYNGVSIDDIISRGLWADWVDLYQAIDADPSLLHIIEKVCLAHTNRDPLAQRHHFWLNHVRYRRGSN